MPIHDNIKLRREELKINQKELAQKVNITQAQISRIETGKSDPTAKVLKKICEILKISSDNILELNIVQDKQKNKEYEQ